MTKKLTMMLAAAVAMAIGARAETEKVGDYTWTYVQHQRRHGGDFDII